MNFDDMPDDNQQNGGVSFDQLPDDNQAQAQAYTPPKAGEPGYNQYLQNSVSMADNTPLGVPLNPNVAPNPNGQGAQSASTPAGPMNFDQMPDDNAVNEQSASTQGSSGMPALTNLITGAESGLTGGLSNSEAPQGEGVASGADYGLASLFLPKKYMPLQGQPTAQQIAQERSASRAQAPGWYKAGQILGSGALASLLPEAAASEGAGWMAKAGAFALNGAIAGSLYNVTDKAGKLLLGQDPQESTAHALLGAGASGALFGGLVGGALGTLGYGGASGLKALSAKVLGDDASGFIADFGRQWTALHANQSLDPQSVLPQMNMSTNSTGQALKDSLAAKIQSGADPFEKMYSEIRETTPNIPLNEKSAAPIGRNIEELVNNPAIGKNSPARKLGLDIVDELGDLKSVEDLRGYKSALNSRISPTASPQEKMLIGQIRDKLDNWEQRTIGNYASNLSSNIDLTNPEEAKIWGGPDGKLTRIQNLQSQIQSANEQYAPFRQKISDLSSWLGKGKIGGPQDAIQFVNNLEPEDLVQKLANKKYAGLSDFLDKNFPEESQIVKNYQKSQMMQAATKSGDFNPAIFYRQFNGMSPELQSGVFNPDEINTIKQSENYFNATKGKYNSMAPGAKAADVLWHVGVKRAASGFMGSMGMMMGADRGYEKGGVWGAVKDGATDAALGTVAPYVLSGLKMGMTRFAVPMALKVLSEDAPYAMAPALEHAGNIQAGQSLMDAGVKSIFGTASRAAVDLSAKSASNKVDTIKKYVENQGLDKEIQHAQEPASAGTPQQGFADGGMAQAPTPVQHLRKVFPDQDTMMAAAKARVYAHLQSQKPSPSVGLPFDSETDSDPAQERKYKKALNLAANPAAIFQSIKDGSLDPEEMEHFQAMWPEIHGSIAKKILEKLVDQKTEGLPMPPYKTRQALSLFMGQPMESTLMPQAIQAAQSVFAAQKAQGQQAPGKQPKAAKNTSKMDKMAAQYRSNQEASTLRHVSAK